MIPTIFLNLCLLTTGEVKNPIIDMNIPYVPRRAVQVQCRVIKAYTVPWADSSGSSSGICLLVAAKKREFHVIVAPVYHIGNYMTFHPGDRVILFGSSIRSENNNILVARWIRKNGITLYLRDVKGKPLWEYSVPVNRKGRKGKGRKGRGSKGKRNSFPGN